MINLNIQYLNIDKLITVVPKIYSQEEFLFLLENRTYDQKFQSFMTFCDESLTQFDMFAMLLQETYSNEGFLDAAKDVLIRFVKWLWRTLTYLGNKIMELFGFAKKDGNTPEAIASRIMCKDSRIPTLNHVRQTYYSDDAIILLHIKEEKDLNSIPAMCRAVSEHASEILQFSKSYCDNPDVKINTLNELLNDIRASFNIQHTFVVNWKHAYDFINTMSELAIGFRAYATTLSVKIKHMPTLSITEHTTYEQIVDQINKIFHYLDYTGTIVSPSSDIRTNIDFIRSIVTDSRNLCAAMYKLDKRVLMETTSVITQMCCVINPLTPDAGVEYIVRVPQSILSKLYAAWNVRFKFDRIIVTNARSTKLFNSNPSSVRGRTISANILGKEISSQEIMINYSAFKDTLRFHVNEQTALQTLKYTNNFNNAEALDIDVSNLDGFLRTMAHECWHLVQDQHQIEKSDAHRKDHTDSSLPIVTRIERQLKYEHEIAARKAANVFMQHITDDDRLWVKQILARGLKIEHKNLILKMRDSK